MAGMLAFFIALVSLSNIRQSEEKLATIPET
jgi:hypothetical protein